MSCKVCAELPFDIECPIEGSSNRIVEFTPEGVDELTEQMNKAIDQLVQQLQEQEHWNKEPGNA